MNPLAQELLTLVGVAAQEVVALTKLGSDANTGARVSGDLLAAINAVLKRHSDNVGQPIEQVLATL